MFEFEFEETEMGVISPEQGEKTAEAKEKKSLSDNEKALSVHVRIVSDDVIHYIMSK